MLTNVVQKLCPCQACKTWHRRCASAACPPTPVLKPGRMMIQHAVGKEPLGYNQSWSYSKHMGFNYPTLMMADGWWEGTISNPTLTRGFKSDDGLPIDKCFETRGRPNSQLSIPGFMVANGEAILPQKFCFERHFGRTLEVWSCKTVDTPVTIQQVSTWREWPAAGKGCLMVNWSSN